MRGAASFEDPLGVADLMEILSTILDWVAVLSALLGLVVFLRLTSLLRGGRMQLAFLWFTLTAVVFSTHMIAHVLWPTKISEEELLEDIFHIVALTLLAVGGWRLYNTLRNP